MDNPSPGAGGPHGPDLDAIWRDTVEVVLLGLAVDDDRMVAAVLSGDRAGVNVDLLQPADPADHDIDDLLAAATRASQTRPALGPPVAVALVCPDRAIAYAQHPGFPLRVVALDSTAIDDPTTRQQAQAGLTRLLAAATTNPPRAFASPLPHSVRNLVNGWRPPAGFGRRDGGRSR